jgi:hypothetical protein
VPAPQVCDASNPRWEGDDRGGDGGFAERVDDTVIRWEHDMSDPAPNGPSTPTIRATTGYLITGAGFLPDHDVTVRVTYPAEDISDCLTYTTDGRGDLHAELPTSPAARLVHIAATDHRTDPDGACRLLWSNTETLQPPDA